MSAQSESDDAAEQNATAWLSVPEVGELLGLDVLKVRTLLKDRQLLARRRGQRAVLSIPADFIADGVIIKGLPGTLSVLRDSGFNDEDAMRWLFTGDESLPGTPVQALRENRGTEVRRRAQALAF
ncbi:MAG: Rv2175c family DNA-binding protein [Sporichthyaceae bacterium]